MPIPQAGDLQSPTSRFTGYSTNVTRVLAMMSPLLTFCVNIGMVVVIRAGGIDAIRGDLTVGQTVAFTNYLI